ncbi:MAG: amidohydrolase family protein [Bryobacterales bacterium]|nr:amidohydrolase family protein [Bryobacterales bacterium]
MLLFSGAAIFDGSGAPAFPGHVLVESGRIESVHRAPVPGEHTVIDCRGLALAPGFIDIHSHSDLKLLECDHAKTEQGVTAEVVGNCGFSAFPSGGRAAAVREYGNAILNGGDAVWEYGSAKAYLGEASRRAKDCAVETLIGHGTLRTAVAGSKQGALTAAEMDRLLGLLREAFEGGAIGISTGLMYAPGSSAPREELLALCRMAASKGKIHTTHMRSYSDDLHHSIEEQLALAREAGCRLQISHLQAVGRRNWDKQARVLERLLEARAQGVDVEFDSYPYLAGSTVMTQLLPQWTLEGGTAALVRRLHEGPSRERILAEMREAMPQRWSDIVVAGIESRENHPMTGRTIEDLALERTMAPAEFALDLLAAHQGRVSIVSFNQSDENLRALLTHPLCTVISDGFYVNGRPHPRLYGTFPSLLGEMSRERGWLPMADAVRRITSKPAARFGLKQRGLIEAGYFADLVLFDPAAIASRATYESPRQSPAGVRAVYRQGRAVL